METQDKSLLSFDQIVKIDGPSAFRLVAILVAAAVVVGLTLRLTRR